MKNHNKRECSTVDKRRGQMPPNSSSLQIGYNYQSRIITKHVQRTNHQHSAHVEASTLTRVNNNNKSVITKQSYLVFDDPEPSNNFVSKAILRISNPSNCFDVFYKLSLDNYQVGFKTRSWKGHVYRNSCAEVPVSTIIVPADDHLNNGHISKGVTLNTFLQTKFILEVSVYINNYRRNYQSYSFNSYGSNSEQQHGGDKFANHKKIRIELQCVTRSVLLKMQGDCKVNLNQIVWQSSTPSNVDNKPSEDNNHFEPIEHANSINNTKSDTLTLECAEVIKKEKIKADTLNTTQDNLETQIENFKDNAHEEESIELMFNSCDVQGSTNKSVRSIVRVIFFILLAITTSLVLANWLKSHDL